MQRRAFLATLAGMGMILSRPSTAASLPSPVVGSPSLPDPTIYMANGVRIGLVPPPPGTLWPAPTLITLATTLEGSLGAGFDGLASLLQPVGWAIVSLDLPAHGQDIRPSEAASGHTQLAGWRSRLEAGEPIVSDFTAKLSSVVSWLINGGLSEAPRLVVSGISRGGFMALHAAAHDARIAATAVFSPVTDLHALSEFTAPVQSSLLATQVEALRTDWLAAPLAGRPLWAVIGHADTRVSTPAARRFALSVRTAAQMANRVDRLDFTVAQAVDHTWPLSANESAATWAKAQVMAPFDLEVAGPQLRCLYTARDHQRLNSWSC